MNKNTDNLPHWERLWRKWIFRLALAFVLAQLALILTSWLVAAAMPDMAVRSLLSSAGIRWFFSNFADKVATPWLTWLIVMAIALGSIEYSGLWQAVVTIVRGNRHDLTSQQRFALRLSTALLAVEVVVMVLLTALPHAVLLSVTGELFPSSFSASLVPVTAFTGTTVAVLYGMLSSNLHGVYDIGQCMCSGCRWLMPLLLLYVLFAEFYGSALYVFG